MTSSLCLTVAQRLPLVDTNQTSPSVIENLYWIGLYPVQRRTLIAPLTGLPRNSII